MVNIELEDFLDRSADYVETISTEVYYLPVTFEGNSFDISVKLTNQTFDWADPRDMINHFPTEIDVSEVPEELHDVLRQVLKTYFEKNGMKFVDVSFLTGVGSC